ncbi:unnamed protein product [Parnassius apollo]|uniref:(apollo) hypothetical protein n=1 Tax=Parnassius apollo TaxID=110799 RepID=A0A8S3WB42_PARAO|nr:unnamed protein product [Parnassius apollo]
MWRVAVISLLAVSRVHCRSNRVIDVSTTCDKNSMAVHITMEQPFKGLVFSKDFSRECRVQGKLQQNVSLHLPSNACGVRTSTLNSSVKEPDDTDDLYYTVELVVQMDRQLQQLTDQELMVRCKLQPRAVRIHSSALEGVIKTKLRELSGQEVKKVSVSFHSHFSNWVMIPCIKCERCPRLCRTGRNRQVFASTAELEREALLQAARAWMQLAPAERGGGAEPAAVEVGQPTRLLVQCTLPVGVGLRITNCIAHDGLGEASQKLLDEAGCPIDESIFGSPTIHEHKQRSEVDISELTSADPQRNIDETTSMKLTKDDPEYMFKKIMTYQHAVVTFSAFKFPDRAKLHLTCGVELCKGNCPKVDCQALRKPQQTRDGLLRKARLDKDARGLVIDRLEVYNSIEVLAPNIELEDEASIRGEYYNFLIEDNTLVDVSKAIFFFLSSRRLDAEKDEFVRLGFSPGDKTICLSPGKMALAFCILGLIFLCAIAVAFAALIRARRRVTREPLHTSLSFYTGSKSMFSSSESSSSGLSGSKLLLTDSPYLDHHSSSSNNWPYARAF